RWKRVRRNGSVHYQRRIPLESHRYYGFNGKGIGRPHVALDGRNGSRHRGRPICAGPSRSNIHRDGAVEATFVVLRGFAHNLRISKTGKIRARASRAKAPSAHQPQPTDVRLGRIVRLLMEHATVVVSGTKIAQEISSNRSEVWRMIQQLRGLGVDVAGHPATGYQLRSVPDLLLPEILRPLLPGTIFEKQLHHFYKIGSTNTAAMAAAAEGAHEG